MLIPLLMNNVLGDVVAGPEFESSSVARKDAFRGILNNLLAGR